MQIKAIEIENFKCFGEKTRIPCAPLTLIYGENGAGKSAILQAINLLFGVVNTELGTSAERIAALAGLGPSISRTRTAHRLDGTENPDGIAALVNRNSKTKSFHIKAEYTRTNGQPGVLSGTFDASKANGQQVYLQISFDGMTAERQYGAADFVIVSDEQTKRSIFNYLLQHKAEINTNWDRLLELRLMNDYVLTHTWDEEIDGWKKHHQGDIWSQSAKTIDIPWIEAAPLGWAAYRSGDAYHARREALDAEIQSEIEFMANEFTYDQFIEHYFLTDGIPLDMTSILCDTVELASSPVIGPPDYDKARINDLPPWSFKPSNAAEVFSLLEERKHQIESELRELQDHPPIQPICPISTPQGVYDIPGIDCLGQNDFKLDVNRWLSQVGAGFQVDVQKSENGSPRIHVIDENSTDSKPIPIEEAGTGQAQLIALLIQCLNAESCPIQLIEKPGLGIAQQLEAELGQLFAHGVRNDKQMIIELNSNNILKSVQKQIADKRLPPDDACILHALKKGSAVHIQSRFFKTDGTIEAANADDDTNHPKSPKQLNPAWLTQIRIKNFKCFEDAVIPLRRLTIIYGQNSSGKSTIAQAVDLARLTCSRIAAKDAFYSTDAEQQSTRTLFGSGKRRDEIMYNLEAGNILWMDSYDRLRRNINVAIEIGLTFRVEKHPDEITKENEPESPTYLTVDFVLGDAWGTTEHVLGSGGGLPDKIIFGYRLGRITDQERDGDSADVDLKVVIETRKSKADRGAVRQFVSAVIHPYCVVHLVNNQGSGCSPEQASQIATYIAGCETIGQSRYFKDFRPDITSVPSELPEISGLYRHIGKLIERSWDYLGEILEPDTLGSYERPDLMHIQASEHFLINTKGKSALKNDLISVHLDKRMGELWHDTELREEVNKVLKDKLNSAHRLDPKGVTDTRSPRPDMTMSFSSVGYGMQYLIPRLMLELKKKAGPTFIEEPEAHVHPQLQAHLGVHYLDVILKNPRRQLIIESHSENLVRSIKQSIRKMQQDSKSISDTVLCLYIKHSPPPREEEPTSTGPEVFFVRIDQDGDFADYWPDGFFPERDALND